MGGLIYMRHCFWFFKGPFEKQKWLFNSHFLNINLKEYSLGNEIGRCWSCIQYFQNWFLRILIQNSMPLLGIILITFRIIQTHSQYIYLYTKNICKRINGLQSKTQTLPFFELHRFFLVIVKVIKSLIYT